MKEYFVCFVLADRQLLTTNTFENVVISSDKIGRDLLFDLIKYIADEKKYCLERDVTIISICPLS